MNEGNRFLKISKWLDKNMSGDEELKKTKKSDIRLYDNLLLEIMRFYLSFGNENESVIDFVERNYKGKKFYEAHKKLAELYYKEED